MEKLKLHSPDLTQENIAKLAELFPNCVTESKAEDGKLKRAIDFDQLRQELSTAIVEGPQERYQLNWPGKREALLTANAPIAKTLRPCREESVDFDTTQNLYIEGDNLDALKLLQETYLNKVKLVYIDPPYNTGKEFIYDDDFNENSESYFQRSNQNDESGNRMVANTESNGRFHSDWLSMIYSRLKLARNLLRDDGVIFISIDDNEQANLKRLCDEIFGEDNFISVTIVQSNPRGRQSDTHVASVHDYILIYAKNSSYANIAGAPLTSEQKAEFDMTDEEGNAYRLLGLRQRGAASRREDRPDMYFPIYVDPLNQKISIDKIESWAEVYPRKSDGSDGRWMWGKEKCKRDINLLVSRLIERRNEFDIFVIDSIDRDGGERTRKYKSIWDSKLYNNQAGTQEVKFLLKSDAMSFPKPVNLLTDVCRMGLGKNDIALDFFSGSATTAHAVIALNAEDGGKRRNIMVQIPEVCDEKSEAYKAGYKTIAEIGKERIRRAGKKIRAENALTAPDLDIGFRVLKIDSSNMKDVYYSPDAVQQSDLLGLVNNIREDRTPEDLLFQVLLDWGVDLALAITQETIAGKQVFFVDGNALAACFETGINEAFVKALAARHPLRAVFRDAGFGSDSVKINIEQIFKLISPTTEVKSI